MIKLKKKSKIKLLDKIKISIKDCENKKKGNEIYYLKLNQVIILIIIVTIIIITIIFMKLLFKEMII